MGKFNVLDGVLELPFPDGPLFLSRQLDGYCKAEYEDWLEARARRRPIHMLSQGLLSQQEYKLSMKEVQASIDSMDLAWGGETCNKSLQQPRGLVQMLSILGKMAGRRKPEYRQQNCTPARLYKLVQLAPEWQQLLADSLAEVMRSSPDFLLPPPEMPVEDDIVEG